jgi:hypothetical protein
VPFFLRVTELPPLSEIVQIPQIVVVDATGPAIPLGTGTRLAMLVGEFLKGPINAPTELTSNGQLASIFGGVSASLSQDASGVQNGGGVTFEGNGTLQLLDKTFKRLGVTRVDTEVVTTDGGTTKSPVTITVTVAAADQAGGFTNKPIVLQAGTRFGNNALFGTATEVVMLSQDVTIPQGASVTSNQVTVSANVVFVKAPEPIAVVASGSVTAVIDAFIPNVATTTTITGVAQAGNMWPPGTGTTLAARIASRYGLAITATLPSDQAVTQEIGVIWAARRTTAIRQALRDNAINASDVGAGRVSVMAADPPTGTDATSAAAGVTAAAALAGTESLQSDRVMIVFPRTQVQSDDLGVAVTINSDGWAASIMNNFPAEKNPGANPAPLLDDIVAVELAYQANPLQKQDYINLLAGGVSPIQHDRTVGWWLVNGITAANKTTQPTRVPMKRRRMADEIQDNLADIAAGYLKEPATTERRDAFTSEEVAYLTSLLSPNNPSAQRIDGFDVDSSSLNTPDLEALGIFSDKIDVRLLASMDNIILQTTIGETVVIPTP